MKSKKHIYMLLIFAIFMLSISAASAAEDMASDINSIDDNGKISLDEIPNDSNEETVLEQSIGEDANDNNGETVLGQSIGEDLNDDENEETVLEENIKDKTKLSEENPTGTFADLNDLINNNTDSEISLERNYTYSQGTDIGLLEGIKISRNLTINGNGYTLNGDGKTRIFNVTAGTVVFKNITFCGGNKADPPEGMVSNGGAISGEATAINCTFTNNHALYGGAMSGGTAINCTFTNNRVYSSGGAMYAGTAINCSFENNMANDNGGALMMTRAENCIFSHNEAIRGGAISDASAINCTFSYNTGTDGAAMYGEEEADGNTALNCEFIENHARSYGGAMYRCTAVLCNFTNNSAYDNGHAICEGIAVSCNFINNDNYEIDIMSFSDVHIMADNYTSHYMKDGKIIIALGIHFHFPSEWNRYLKDIEAEIDLYQNGAKLDTYHSLTSNNWTFDLKSGSYYAIISIPMMPEVSPLTIELNISRATTNITSENLSTIYNSDDCFTVTLKDEYGNLLKNQNVTVYGLGISQKTYQTDENGQVKVPIKNVPTGKHTAEIYSYNTEYYQWSSTTAEINISKSTPYFDCESVYVHDYLEYENVTIQLKDQFQNPIAHATVTFDLDGVTTTQTDENGKIYIATQYSAAGNYMTNLVFNETRNYYGTRSTIMIIINRLKPTLDANNITMNWNDEETLVISLKNDTTPLKKAKIYVCLNELEEHTTDDNGEVEISIKDMPAGTYIVGITYEGNENYTGAIGSAKITVQKTSATLNVRGDRNLIYGDNATVTVSLMDDETGINGTVIITVNNLNYAVNVSEGKGELSISNLIPDNYAIAAKFLGNDHYDESTFDGEAYIEFNGKYAKFDMIIPDGTYGENLTIIIENATDHEGKNLNGTVIVMAYNENSKIVDYAEIKVTDGSGTNLTTTFSAGNLHARAFFYSDDWSYKSQWTTYYFNVAKAAPSLAANYVEGKLEITLDGVNEEKLDETITIAIDGEEKDYETNDGTYSLAISNLGSGKHSAYVVFKGNDNYLSRSTYAVFTLSEKIQSQIISQDMIVTAVDTVTDGNLTEYFTITLKDKSGNPLANKTIQIGYNGKAYDISTDKDGKASLEINLDAAGEYSIAVSYFGDENYEGSFAVAKITVNAQKGNLTVPSKTYKASAKTKTLTARFISASGKAVKGKKVTFTVNGKTYTATTNDEGLATVKVNLSKKGTYKFTVNFAGDKTYEAMTETGKLILKAEKGSLKVPNKSYKARAKTKTLTARFISASKKAVKGKKIVFIVNKKKYTAKTNKNGIAKVKVKLSKKGTYKFTAKFAGDNTYAAMKKTAKLRIK